MGQISMRQVFKISKQSKNNLTNTNLLDTYGWIIFQNKKKYVNVTKCHIIVHNNGLIYCYLGYKFLSCCCY